MQIGKEVKLSLSADNILIVFYIKSAKNLLELIHEFSEVIGYKFNTQKSITFPIGTELRK